MIEKDKIYNWVIYKITSPNGRVYIGKTINLRLRKNSYRSMKCITQRALYNSFMYYGFKNHIIEVVETFVSELLYANYREIFWIKEYKSNKNKYPNDNGLNLTDGGDGTPGRKISEEHMRKFTERQKAGLMKRKTPYKVSDETKKILSDHFKKFPVNAHLGKPRSQEVRDKISASLKGKPSPNKGKKSSPETILKLSKAITGTINLKRRRTVLVYDLKGNFIEEIIGVGQTAKNLNMQKSQVEKVLSGKNKRARGYFFKYKLSLSFDNISLKRRIFKQVDIKCIAA